MSIMRMRKMFRDPIGRAKKHQWWASPMFLVFVAIIIIFIVGAFYSFGPGGRSGGSDESKGSRKVSSVIAVVDGAKINRNDFEARYRLMVSNQPGGGDVTRAQDMKTQLLDGLIENMLLQKAEKKEGIKVSGKQVEEKRQKLAEDAINGEYPDRKDLLRFLKKKQMSYEQYRDQVISDRYKNDAPIREQLMEEGLEKAIKDKVQPTEQQIKDSYTEVKASHILIDPQGLKKRMQEQAKKEGKEQQQVQQDWDALAKKKAEDLLAQVKTGADFATLAKDNSDDPGSGAKGGDLGWFKQGQMVPEFDAVAFQLQPGQVSDVVKSQFGYHIIKVEDRRQKLPDDFDKDKQKYTTQVTEDLKNKAWQQYRDALKKAAKIEYVDAELKAYELMKDRKEDEAAPYLDKAVRDDPQNAGAKWALAELYQQAGEKEKAMQLLAQLVENEQGASSPQVRMTYARALQEAGKAAAAAGNQAEADKDNAAAVDQYKQASGYASALDMMNYMVHMQVKQALQELKATDAIKDEDKWIADFQEQQKKSGGMGMGMGGPMGGMMPMTIPGPSK